MVDRHSGPALSSRFSELQEKAAKLLGVEQTLFVPTNTMANLISGECLPTLGAGVCSSLVDTWLGFFWVQPVEHLGRRQWEE